jgi:benzoyl-CoA reductase subunit C
VDVVRAEAPGTPVYFGQWPTSLSDGWTLDVARTMVSSFIQEMGAFTGRPVTAAALAASIALFNENRRLLRGLFEARRAGDARFSPTDLQVLVKSSMVMDKAEHTALLRQVVAQAESTPRDDRIRLHLSGHFCHAPKPGLLQAIEDCGAIVVDDDLYHGARYLSTDVREHLEPAEAISDWYLRRDVNLPCPTRVKHGADWEDRLLSAIAASGAQGVIVLMAKFCEPHMLYYPELRKRLTEQGVPHLLIETEHEGVPVETVRTRVEALLERIRRTQLVNS